MSKKYQQLILLIEPYVPNLTKGYEAARLLEIYSSSLFHEKKEGWQDFSDRAAMMYEEMNIIGKRASIGIFRAMAKFIEHDYAQSLSILLQERNGIEAKHTFIDPMTRVDLDYHEAILHFAVGDSKSATRVMEAAITFSKENRIFYRINDLYRLAAAHAALTYNEEKKAHYSQKLKQYGEFADDIQSILFFNLFNIMSLISDKHEYMKALEIIDQYLSDSVMDEIYKYWYLHEKGKALYGLGLFQEALAYLEKVEIPAYAHHPFDLSLFYIRDAYKALCQLELGNLEEALKAAKMAVLNFEVLPHTPYKDFASETYDRVLTKRKTSAKNELKPNQKD